jgi:hypothetical protein
MWIKRIAMNHTCFTVPARAVLRKFSAWMFCLFILGGTASLHAQPALGIGGGGQIFNFRDTVYLNDTDSYYVYVKNKGNAFFSGLLTIFTAVDSTGTGNNFIIIDSTTFTSQIASGDSIQFFRSEFYMLQGNYRVGGNIVVIWPSSSGITTTDSSQHTTVWMLLGNSVFEIDRNKSLVVFPNPSSDLVNVHLNSNFQVRVERIRIFDSQGRIQREYHGTNRVSLKEHPEGVYLVEACFDDGTCRTYKVIRQE